MELVLIKIDSIEWNVMWDWVGSHPINQGIENPSVALNEGEGWQYMGTIMQGNKAIHQIRHKHHPVTNTIQNISCNASESFTKDQIAKEFKI